MKALAKWWRALWSLTGLACQTCGRQACAAGYDHEFNPETKRHEVVAISYMCPKAHCWIILKKD